MRNASYDDDLVLWAECQARALRDAAHTKLNSPIDWENVAEEIADLANRQKRDLASRIGTILAHLAKLLASPAQNPRAGWKRTIRTHRAEIRRLLKDAGSLAETVPAVIQEELADAKARAMADIGDYGETHRVDVAAITFAEDQVTGDWFPADMTDDMP